MQTAKSSLLGRLFKGRAMDQLSKATQQNASASERLAATHFRAY